MSARTLEALAAEHGIIAVHKHGPAKGYGPCPACGATQRSASDRRGPIWIGPGRGGHDAWRCHPCGAGGGGAKLLALLGTPRPARLDLAPSPRRVATLDLDRGWQDLAAVAGHWRPLVAAWAEDVRGWGPELARAVARLPDVAWTDLPKVKLAPDGRALVTAAGTWRPLLVVQWAGDARWSAECRWVASTPPADGKKALALDTERVGDRPAGVPRTFGSLAAATAALRAGETVALVEGSPDYLAAAGAGLVALGAASAGELAGIGAALAAALPAGAPGAVVCIAHTGDRLDVGAVSMRAAAEALRGVVRVQWCDLSPRLPAGKGDLADAVRLAVADGADGIAAVRELVAAAGDLSAPPTPPVALDAAGPAIVAELAPPPEPRTLRVLAVPYGVGKTHTGARWLAEQAPLDPAGPPVIHATPTHELAAEVAAGAAEVPGTLPPIHHRGLLAKDANGEPICRALADTLGDARQALAAALAASGRAVCRHCPHRETCPIAPAPELAPGRLHVMTLAQLRTVEVPEGALVVLDDCGATAETVERTGPAVAALADAHGIAESEALAAKALAALADATPDDDAPEGEREIAIMGAALVERLRALPALVELAAEATAAGKHPEDLTAPEPAARLSPSAGTLGGVAVERRGPAAEREARAVVLMAAALVAGLAPHKGATLELVAGADGRRAWRITRPPILPAAARIIALDGGAHRRRETWAHAARVNGRTLDLRTVRVLAPRVVPAYHRVCRALDRGRVLSLDTEGRRWWREDAPGALRAALVDLAERLRADGIAAGARVAVLTHKPLADALAGSDDYGATEAAELRAVWREWCDACGVEAEALDEDADAERLALGYFGRHDRGHNAWRGVAVVALLGTPRPPPGLMRSLARAYLPDADADDVEDLAVTLGREATAETMAQGLARGRHLREPGLRLLYLSTSAEVAPGPDLPGLHWTRYEAGPGDGAGKGGGVALAVAHAGQRAAAEAHAEAHGAVAGVRLAVELSTTAAPLDARRARRMAAEVGRARGWIETTISRAVVWAPDRFKASKYAETHVLSTVPQEHASAHTPAHARVWDDGLDVENQALRPFEPQPEAAASTPAPLPLAPLQPDPPDVDRVVDDTLGRLMERIGHGAPTAAELAAMAGCPLDTAAAALAAGMELAEGYADARGADWPPPAWAAPPKPERASANRNVLPAPPAEDAPTPLHPAPPSPRRTWARRSAHWPWPEPKVAW